MKSRYKKKTFTVKDIMSLDPCTEWGEEAVSKVFAGKKRLSPTNVWNIGSVSFSDKAWLLLHLLPCTHLNELAYAGLKDIADYGDIDDIELEYDGLGSGMWSSPYEKEFWRAYRVFCEPWMFAYSLIKLTTIAVFEDYLKKWGYIK